MQLSNFETSLTIPISYIHLNKSENKPLLILLHGFADSAKSFLNRAMPQINTEVEILAINGPFPIPQKKGNEWKHAFAWYFADHETKTVYIHPQVAARAVGDLIDSLNLQARPKIIVGFSQGGFFAPHLIKNLDGVLRVLTIGAGYRPEDYPENFSGRVDALHGMLDEVIPYDYAKSSFEKLSKINSQGEFFGIADMTHKLNDGGRQWLRTKIEESIK